MDSATPRLPRLILEQLQRQAELESPREKIVFFLRKITMRSLLSGRELRYTDVRNRLFKRKGIVAQTIILLTFYVPLKTREIYDYLSSTGITDSYEVVKKTIERLHRSGVLQENNGYYSINYYYQEALREVFEDSDYEFLFLFIKDSLKNKKKLYNLSLKKGQLGTVGDTSGHFYKKLNKKEFFEKIKKTAEQKLSRKLEKPEEKALEILSDHYHTTKSLWIDPQTFEERLFTKSSSSYRIDYSIDDIWKALNTLASHKIAYVWVRNGRKTKVALYREFVREAEKQ